jgi:excisionase family DNA binding protein
MEKLLYSPNSAAQALDCARSTIYAMMKIGRIKWVYVGADRRIPASEIQRIASEGATTKSA